MPAFNELQEAEIRLQFRRMYADIGFTESLVVLNELMITARILAEILAEEHRKDEEEKGMGTA